MSSDDSAIFIESESASIFQTTENPDLEELYKHIPPPIPLVPKNKYKENMTFELKTFERDSIKYPHPNTSFQHLAHNSDGLSSKNIPSLDSICSGSNIIYQKDLSGSGNPSKSYKLKLNNLPVLTKIDCKPLFENKTDTLVFESRFESGNLAMALKKTADEYDLLMQNDTNTKGHTQWFYYKVANYQAGPVKFNIINFSKKDSLFNYGMRVLTYSEKAYKTSKTGWCRGGRDISYYSNGIPKEGSSSCYYTLSFTYDFAYESDTVQFAYCYPYTYTELLKDLDIIEYNNTEIVKRQTLCKTIADKRCDILTITAPGTAEDIKKRKGAFISARVHPGETVGSFMMKGLINFLVSSSKEAGILREKYVFKIVPMLNPDGVVFGNYRCGLAGADLNRTWKLPSKILNPTIYASKKFIKSFIKERNVDFICDLHGHSKKKNIFMYGCNLTEAPEHTRAIPYILSKISPYFFYPYCSFRMQKSKEATLRISIFKETKVCLIYTLEASFLGGNFVNII
jgi:cytosolic carboxypeptidase protein 2/3